MRRSKGGELFAFGFGALALCVMPQARANLLEICDGKTATIINAGSTAKVGNCNAQGKNGTTFLLASNGDGAAVHGHDNGTLTLRGNNGVQIHGHTSLNGNKLGNLAAGTADADAVNVGQLRPLQHSLQQVNGALGTLESNLGKANGHIASLGTSVDSANRHIAGLKNGLDTSNGTIARLSGNLDSTNGHLAKLRSGLDTASSSIARLDSHLGASNAHIDRLLGALGGGAAVDAAGNVVQPIYRIQGHEHTGVDGALSALDTGLDTAKAHLARLDGSLGNGSAGLIRQAAPGEDITLAKDLDGERLTIAGSFDEAAAGGGSVKKIRDRRLSGLAAGTADNDAVNLGQLKQSGLFDRDGAPRHAVTYDSADKAMVSFGGTGGSVLANVAPGQIADGSMQAVNGGQLHALQEHLQGQLHGLDGRVGKLETATSDASHHQDMSRSASDTGAAATDQHANDGSARRTGTDTSSQITTNNGSTVPAASPAQPRQIAHVAAGAARTDAANWGQVQDAIGEVRHWTRRRFAQMDRRIAGMGAMGAAMAQMAFSAQGLAQANRVAVGVGRQGNRSALALGYSHQLHANLNLSLGGAASGDDASMGAGLALGW